MIAPGIQDQSAAVGLLISVSFHSSTRDSIVHSRRVSNTSSLQRTDQSETVDLINDAGFKVGDAVNAWVDVEAGIDASANIIFVVGQNGSAASFDASGTTLNTKLTYTGTN